MTRKNVKVTRSVKELILGTAKIYKYFNDLADPLKNRNGDWKDWQRTAWQWMDALMSECVLCGLSGNKVTTMAKTFDGIERMTKMSALEFAVEFERVKEEVAA